MYRLSFGSLLPLVITAPVYHKGADKQHCWKYLRGIQRHYHFQDKPVRLLINPQWETTISLSVLRNRLEVSLRNKAPRWPTAFSVSGSEGHQTSVRSQNHSGAISFFKLAPWRTNVAVKPNCSPTRKFTVKFWFVKSNNTALVSRARW